jgi:hypothetical protein
MNIVVINIVPFFVTLFKIKNPTGMKLIFSLLILLISLQSFSQDKPAYKVFTAEGKKADYSDMIKSALKSDIVFVGELKACLLKKGINLYWVQKCLNRTINFL